MGRKTRKGALQLVRSAGLTFDCHTQALRVNFNVCQVLEFLASHAKIAVLWDSMELPRLGAHRGGMTQLSRHGPGSFH